MSDHTQGGSPRRPEDDADALDLFATGRAGADRPGHADDDPDAYGAHAVADPDDAAYADDYDPEYDDELVAIDEERQRRQKRKNRVVLGTALVLVLAGLLVAGQLLGPMLGSVFEKKDYDGPGSGQTTVVVNPGDTGAAIGESLEKAGVVKTAGAFVEALDASEGAEIQPGTYTMKREMKASDAVAALRDTDKQNLARVTLREGMWKNEVFAALSKATGRPVAEYAAAEKAAAKNPGLLGLPPSAKGNVEGYLFPATYSFAPNASAQSQLKEMIGHSTQQLRSLGVAPADMEKVVTVASIVENEARLDADRPKVARVIYNRLDKNIPLELDSTVSYGVQKRTVTTSDHARDQNNGYNTYKRRGLPVGPIGNPGAASIKAAQNPAKGPWLFFVAVDPETGETKYGSTPDEHAKNVAEFQAWCQSHPGKCTEG